MKRLIALLGVTTLTAVMGVGTAVPSLADTSGEPGTSAGPVSTSHGAGTIGAEERLSTKVQQPGDPSPRDIRRHNVEQGSVDIPPKTLEKLVTRAVLKNDPSASPEEIEEILDALSDIGKIIAAIEPADMARVGDGVAQVSAAVAAVAAGNLEAARDIVCGSGDAAAGSLQILEDVVRIYEKSKNLPQIEEVLNLLDPTTPGGAELWESLPDEAQTPELKAALVALAEIGRTLNEVDKQKVITLAKDWAEAAAKCNVQSLLEVPRLAVRTFEMARDILDTLNGANLGDLGVVLAPEMAVDGPAGDRPLQRNRLRQPSAHGEGLMPSPSTIGR